MRILVVDDHELVRKGIRSLLGSEPSISVCGEAVDGQDAIEKAGVLRPDAIIMDISMPGVNGLAATREIKQRFPNIRVVIVSQHDSPEMARQAFNAGAVGYVLKTAVSADLLVAVQRATQNETFVSGMEPFRGNLDAREILQRSAAFEGALRESEERFRLAMNNMAEGLYTVDTEGRATYVNPAAEAMFGWTSAELLGKVVHEVTHYKHPDGTPFPASDCPGLQVLKKGVEVRNHEDVFIHKDGTFFPVMFSASPLHIANETTGIVVCFRDDTRRREAEKLFEERINERTDELLKARNELRTLSVRLLRAQDEERRRIARELHDGVGQLLAAMSMHVSRIDSEAAGISEEATKSVEETRNLIDQALRDIRTMSYLLHPPLLDEIGLGSALQWYLDGFGERSKIAVSLDLAPDLGKLERDLELSLFRIVQECLTNIHRHSGSDNARVRLYRKPGKLLLEVEDDGKGIAPDVLRSISSGESFGLGLRGIRERLRPFGGQLELQSNGRGTIATAIVPDAAAHDKNERSPALGEQENPMAQSEKPTVPADEAATILCIDDEFEGMLARKLLLESAGHRVLESKSGEEGLRLFQTEKIDVVVLDYWMSGMKGTTVATELKRIDPTLPIIVLSGLPDFPGESAGLVDEWLLKGNNRPEHLLDTIKTLLERRSA